jgi:hypothetical protein
LKNDQYFYCGKLDHKTKEYYTRLTEVNKSKSDTYVKKETANIVEADSESDSSQYSVSIIRVLILVPNSKGKKMLRNALIDCRATVSLIDLRTIKEEKFRTETTLQQYRLYQAFSNKIEVATRMIKKYITISSKEFMSKKLVPLLVTLLNYSEIILRMPFFKQENIRI